MSKWVTRFKLVVVLGGTVILLIVFWHVNFPREDYHFDILTLSNGLKVSNSVYIPYRSVIDPYSDTPGLIGSENVTQKDKYIIYRCGGGITVCGGYSNRIKGAMTAFMIANLTGRTFKMEMLFDSCDLHQFIVPNKVDWYLPKSFHPTIKSGHNEGNFSVLYIIDKDLNPGGEDKDYLALPGMESTYFYFTANRDTTKTFQASIRYKQQLSWMSHLTRGQMNAAIYKHLFQPSQYLQNKLVAFFKDHLQPHDNLVCAHLRFAQNPTMPSDKPRRIKTEDLPNVWIFLNEVIKRKENVKIFLMTDNENIVSESKKRHPDKIFFSPGPIVHVDRYSSEVKPETVCEGLEKVIFEQLVLMHCDVLVVAKSGLGEMAAYLRGKDDGLYCFVRSGKVLPCSRNDIPMLFYGHT